MNLPSDPVPDAGRSRPAGEPTSPRFRPAGRGALHAHIDGGARGNPGASGYGVHLTDAGDNLVDEVYGFLGVQTNNVAEYIALIAALEYGVRSGAGSMEVRSDSQLLVRQIQGLYRVKNAGLQPLYARARALIRQFGKFRIEHVYREQNREADALANRAMDSREGSGHFDPSELLGR